jgi:hypothetical protein
MVEFVAPIAQVLSEHGPVGLMLVITISTSAWLLKRHIAYIERSEERSREGHKEFVDALHSTVDKIGHEIRRSNMEQEQLNKVRHQEIMSTLDRIYGKR